MLRRFKRSISGKKPKARIIRVDRITPGKQHAWCESDQGMIRKPLASIPAGLLKEFRETRA